MKNSKKRLKILLVDNHALLRLGLRALFSNEADFTVVGEAADGGEAVLHALKTEPDIIIMDLMMPGIPVPDAIKEITTRLPDVKIIILTSYGTAAEISSAISAGAVGAIVKDTPNEHLPDILRRIYAGENVFSPEIGHAIEDLPTTLTDRQREILTKVADGFTSAEIASAFSISADAVNKHINLICTHLGAANRTEAVAIALRKHLLKI